MLKRAAKKGNPRPRRFRRRDCAILWLPSNVIVRLELPGARVRSSVKGSQREESA